MKKQLRRHKDGTFRYNSSNFAGLKLLLVTMALSAYLDYRFAPQPTPISPLGAQIVVHAVEPAVQPIVEPPMTIEDKVRAMFPEDPDRAVAIAKCESGLRANAFNPKNKNGSWDAGVMQINSVHKYSKEYLFDVDNNLKVARKLYDRQGWRPWVCARKVK